MKVVPEGESQVIAQYENGAERVVLVKHDNCYVMKCEQKFSDVDKWWTHSSITLPLEG